MARLLTPDKAFWANSMCCAHRLFHSNVSKGRSGGSDPCVVGACTLVGNVGDVALLQSSGHAPLEMALGLEVSACNSDAAAVELGAVAAETPSGVA
eukprot:CAMPEP_0117610406 /NCGR_PEP_ID=MMETSP0784-20121206/81857_1 /TAXON_ID=39447 /ORGANISM="" /LENGTH=95 /DNA_ID=CAMNT_0005413809 /DNA_START=157 /DNA_END=440 /DNA_ORIENTATION=+